ncbi:FGGY-family carbohydrate kinase [Aestuariivirga sp.]|uniref:FGGY-family carbohydrate kinase n=1 Tax=Aestuariivirga sp. TaxID=2650926 RepID=UPI0039E71C9D
MKHYLGVDVGTYETKGVIVTGEGVIVAQAARPHQMMVPQPGWAEHDAERDWWGDFVFVTRRMLAESGIAPSSIAAIGCSAIGPCVLPVDREGRPLMNAILYGVDTRATAEIAEFNETIGEDVIMRTCRNALSTQATGPKMLWLKRNRPEIFARTHKLLNSTSYLNFRLTSVYAVDHYSAGNSAPYYLPEKLAWSDELAPGTIPLSLMPDLRWTTDVIGHVTPEAAAETGLAAGTPVIAGTIDAAAEAVSVGVTSPGQMMVMYGSTIFIIEITAAAVSEPRLWYAPWLFEGQHAAMAGVSTAGTLTHWLRRIMASDLAPADAIRILNEEAQTSPPGANGLVALPYFSGALTPLFDAGAKGAISGLDLTHTRGDIFRAALEGIAQATRHIIETYASAGQPPCEVFAVGGGTKSQVWSQATSDSCGFVQKLREKTWGASFGDAFLAALAVGDVYPGDMEKWNPVVNEVAPDPATRATYDRLYARFRGTYEVIKPHRS